MQIFDFLAQEHVSICVNIQSKTQLLEHLSTQMASFSGLNEFDLFNEFTAREELNSTGLGYGMALPHIRLADLTAPIGAFFLLKSPIEFDSIDQKTVDLVFALAVPESETCQHLKIISKIAELFSQACFRDNIRNCIDNQSIFNLLQLEMRRI